MDNLLLQRSIGAALKQLRQKAGLSRAQAAERVHATYAKYKSYEEGKVLAVEPAMVEKWGERLGAPSEISEELDRMACLIRGNVTRWELTVPQWFGAFVQLESTASKIDILESELITGLLQTPEYMEATVCASALIPPDRGDAVKEVRRRRQEELFGRKSGPPQMRIVINEGALKRIAHETFFDGQLEHLRRINAYESVQLYLLPFSASVHAATSASFMVMDFENTPDPSVVHIEGIHSSYYESNADIIAVYRKVFEAVLEDTVPFEESEYGSTSVA